jgi:GNAT superfamily N-acetyltransferase
MNPELHIYRSGAELPLHYYYQAQAFMRIVWGDLDNYDMDYGLQEEAQHVVVARGKTLISYAAVIWITLEFEGEHYRCYGLTGVMTYPHFRGRGYGGQVVAAATDIIRQDPAADMGLLWTAENNAGFYAKYSWEVMPDLTTLYGDPQKPTVADDELRLILFVSDKASAARDRFAHGRLYVGAETW